MTDFTINGKCSSCGSCCGDILPLSDEDIRRIRKYVRKHHIKQYQQILPVSEPVLNLSCPFRDNGKRTCLIYEVRPWICHRFKCDQADGTIVTNKTMASKSGCTVSMLYEFFGDSRNKKIAELTQQCVRDEINSGKMLEL